MVMKKRSGEARHHEESKHLKGVRYLCESGVKRLPPEYILPPSDRPQTLQTPTTKSLNLPTIDLSLLQDAKHRPRILQTLSNACKEYGFFQVVKHGIPGESVARLTSASRRFFRQPYEERAKYMSNDIRAPVRCGTSFNQLQDGVFYWRDFLKLNCHPLHTFLHSCPSSPFDLREEAMTYAKQTKDVFLELMKAILETLGLGQGMLHEFEQGTQMMVMNHFPPCPEPGLTLGMPPHSDYGFLTILLQDKVKGLQVQHEDDWITIDPIVGSLFVNVGDHLEIFSNGRYKSVLHRVVVNRTKARNSIATLHSLPFESIVRPPPEIVDREERLYADTDFASFLNYMTSHETKHKGFLESRKVVAGGQD